MSEGREVMIQFLNENGGEVGNIKSGWWQPLEYKLLNLDTLPPLFFPLQTKNIQAPFSLLLTISTWSDMRFLILLDKADCWMIRLDQTRTKQSCEMLSKSKKENWHELECLQNLTWRSSETKPQIVTFCLLTPNTYGSNKVRNRCCYSWKKSFEINSIIAFLE